MLAWFAAFLMATGVMGAGFAVATTGESAPEGYLAYALIDDAPFEVIYDPPAPGTEPRTDAIVTGSVASVALSLPNLEATQLIFQAAEQEGIDPIEGRAQRITSTGARPDGSLSPFITVALLLDRGYAQVLGMTVDGSLLLSYDPPLLQLPADPSPGQTWSVEGLTAGFAPYSLSGTVLAEREVSLPPGLVSDSAACIDVRTRLDQGIPNSEGYIVETVAVWCPGRHIVASLTDSGDRLRQALPEEVVWGPAEVPPLAEQPPGTALSLPILSALVRRPPVSVPGGVIMANDQIRDILRVSVVDSASGTSAGLSTVTWLQHPGGSVLGIDADSDRILVTTSSRVLAGYDHAGRLRWSIRLADVAAGSPVVIGDTVAVALVDGTLRGFAVDTGAARWVQRLSDVVTESAVRVDDMVVAADSAGYVVAVDEQGAIRWAGGLDPVAGPLSALSDGTVLIPQSRGVVTRLDAAGDEMWSSFGIEGRINAASALWGDVIALPTSDGLLGLDQNSGDVTWVLPEITSGHLGSPGLVATGDRVLVVSDSGDVTVLADGLVEMDGAEPINLFVTRLGDQWIAVTRGGRITFLDWNAGE
jgi:outer membrane protein assembly factor BamB